MKKLLIKILAHPWIGRPLRKIFWTLIVTLKWLLKVAVHIYHRLPYVRSLSMAARVETPAAAIVRYYGQLRDRLAELSYQPKISVIVPVYKVDETYFRQCLESVAFQIYEKWELCIVDDASKQAHIPRIVKEFQERFPGKVHFKENEKNSHISITSNECLKLATGDYIALLDHDDLLLPNALGEMVRHIHSYGQPDILYSDERVIDGQGVGAATPYFKPDWSKYMHLSVNYTTHLSVYKKALIDKIGGFRPGFEGAQDHDLMLRAVEATEKPVVHVPFVLYQWRAHENSTAMDIGTKSYAATNGEKAVTEALTRRGIPGTATFEPETVHYRVKYDLPKHLPKISIVIPTRNCLEYLRNCIDSILSKSTYRHYEIILVDNGSDDEECFRYYETLKEQLKEQITILHDRYAFNFGKQVNLGVAAATGEYVLLLNNDTIVISEDWLEELLRHAALPDVGAVGCKLLYKNMIIQHAGISLVGQDIAVAVHGLNDKNTLYCQIMQTTHEVSSVTAACMMVKKELFHKVDGFNQNEVANGYGDVDFCLKLARAGYVNLYTPYARLYHVESPSRGVSFEYFERIYMRKKWGALLLNDPYYNPNFIFAAQFVPEDNSEYQDIQGQLMKLFLERPFSEWKDLALKHSRFKR